MGYNTEAEFMAIFLALFVILIMGVILKHALRNKTEAVRHIPLMIVGAFILLFEVTKQTYHLVNHNWNTWHVPLHFCSYFLVWYGVALFTRGKIRQIMYSCSLVGGILVSLLLCIAPDMILHNATTDIFGSFDHFHTYFYHMAVMAYWIWMLMLNVYHPQRQHLITTIILHGIFFFVTIIGAHVFQTNYTNVLHSDISIMETLRYNAGQFTYTIVLALVGVLAVSIVASSIYYITKKLYKQNLNKEKITIEK